MKEVTDEDLAPPGTKPREVSDADLAPRSKYPAPRSESMSDAELGIDRGPLQTKFQTNAGPIHIQDYREAPAQGPIDKIYTDQIARENAADFAGAIGGQIVGSAVVPIGEGLGAPIGRAIIGKLGAAGPKIASAASKLAPNTTEIIKKAVEHSQAEAGKLAVARAVGQDVVSLAKATGSAGVNAARTVAPVVARAGGADVGKMSNILDRLRVSQSPAAQDLLNRITQYNPDFPTGSVDQGTLGGGQ